VKVVRNDRYIQTRSKIGRYASLGGLAVLAGGLLTSFLGQQRPELITLSFVCLLIGFVLSQVGIYYGNRFVRPDRPDEALTKALKGLDDRFILYHYQLPAPHVLLAPDACYVLAVQQQSGKVSARGDRWKHPLGWKWLFAWASQESIGNPTKAAQLEVETLQAQLAKKLPNVEVPLTPVVVFSNPDVELDVSDTAVPAIHIKKLKDWLRGAGKGQGLPASTRAEMLKLFGNGD
jgi:hypothetical protein